MNQYGAYNQAAPYGTQPYMKQQFFNNATGLTAGNNSAKDLGFQPEAYGAHGYGGVSTSSSGGYYSEGHDKPYHPGNHIPMHHMNVLSGMSAAPVGVPNSSSFPIPGPPSTGAPFADKHLKVINLINFSSATCFSRQIARQLLINHFRI